MAELLEIVHAIATIRNFIKSSSNAGDIADATQRLQTLELIQKTHADKQAAILDAKNRSAVKARFQTLLGFTPSGV